MKIIALLAVRNEAVYLPTCLDWLESQGVQAYVIDNDSTDDTLQIVRSHSVVIGWERYPWGGHFDLAGQMLRKQQLAAELDADWFIHHDADEIRQSRRAEETLHDAIARLDAAGFNAINFDEFVFIPDRFQAQVEGHDYLNDFYLAYYFAPQRHHRINAWKKTDEPVDLVSSGGHHANFTGRRLASEHLILRHYPYLSWRHLARKYGRERIYSPKEVREWGWHGRRARFDIGTARMPPKETLVLPHMEGWRTDRPLKAHPFLGEVTP